MEIEGTQRETQNGLAYIPLILGIDIKMTKRQQV